MFGKVADVIAHDHVNRAISSSGYADELPAGDYDVLADDDVMLSRSYATYRRTTTFQLISGPLESPSDAQWITETWSWPRRRIRPTQTQT